MVQEGMKKLRNTLILRQVLPDVHQQVSQQGAAEDDEGAVDLWEPKNDCGAGHGDGDGAPVGDRGTAEGDANGENDGDGGGVDAIEEGGESPGASHSGDKGG